MSGHTLKVGDQLWLVELRGRTMQGRYVTVTKVGRKWSTIVDAKRPTFLAGRIDNQTLAVDSGGYGTRDRCYLSRDEYEAEADADKAWEAFQQQVRNIYRRPDHLAGDEVRRLIAAIARAQAQGDAA